MTLEERIAVLETEMKDVKETNEQILAELKIVNSSMARYKGFMGGVMFVGSCMVTLFTIFGSTIKAKFGLA